MKITVRLPKLHTLREIALTVGGLGLLSAAAWTITLAAGLAAAGISLLLLEWLSRDPGGGQPR